MTTEPVVVWVNGTFGAGKSSVAAEVARRAPEVAVFDPEHVGAMLSAVVAVPTGDFQDLPIWRSLVVATCRALVGHGATPLLAPMTLLREPYGREIFEGLQAGGIRVVHVLLHATPEELRRRILHADLGTGPDPDPVDDPAVRRSRQRWRLAHLADYEAALPWLRASADLVIDTTGASVTEVAAELGHRAGLVAAREQADRSALPREGT